MQGSLKHSVVISACSCWHRNTAMFCKDRSTVQAISGRGLIWLEIVDCDIDQIKIITREDYENGRIINSKSYKGVKLNTKLYLLTIKCIFISLSNSATASNKQISDRKMHLSIWRNHDKFWRTSVAARGESEGFLTIKIAFYEYTEEY